MDGLYREVMRPLDIQRVHKLSELLTKMSVLLDLDEEDITEEDMLDEGDVFMVYDYLTELYGKMTQNTDPVFLTSLN